MYMTDYMENKMAKMMTGEDGGFTKPLKYYIGLYDSANESTFTEFTAPSYSRQEIKLKTVAGKNGYVTNAEDIIFPIAETSWGMPLYACLCEAQTGRNELVYISTMGVGSISVGNQLVIRAESMSIYFE